MVLQSFRQVSSTIPVVWVFYSCCFIDPLRIVHYKACPARSRSRRLFPDDQSIKTLLIKSRFYRRAFTAHFSVPYYFRYLDIFDCLTRSVVFRYLNLFFVDIPSAFVNWGSYRFIDFSRNCSFESYLFSFVTLCRRPRLASDRTNVWSVEFYFRPSRTVLFIRTSLRKHRLAAITRKCMLFCILLLPFMFIHRYLILLTISNIYGPLHQNIVY